MLAVVAAKIKFLCPFLTDATTLLLDDNYSHIESKVRSRREKDLAMALKSLEAAYAYVQKAQSRGK